MTATAERAEVTATYRIRLRGCDDVTEFGMDLTDDHAALLGRVAARSREASEFDCQPTMTVDQGEAR